LPLTAICFWNIPPPSTGTFRLPAGKSSSLVFSSVKNDADIVWSGNLGFSTAQQLGREFNETQCDTKGCAITLGPFNTAEFTLPKKSADFIDISIIGGVNVPFNFAPILTTSKYSPSQPYSCGAPGAVQTQNGLWEAPWTFKAPSVFHQWVSRGGKTCSSNADCATSGRTDQACGLNLNPGATPSFELTCGVLLGFWSADRVCGIEPAFEKPFDCNLTLSKPNQGLPLTLLYLCAGDAAKSCYQPGALESCCGCVDWSDALGSSVSPNTTAKCFAHNPNFEARVRPQIEWLKSGCPSCYTYPFDDVSSIFVCSQQDQAGFNQIDYTLDLCPTKAPSTEQQQIGVARS